MHHVTVGYIKPIPMNIFIMFYCFYFKLETFRLNYYNYIYFNLECCISLGPQWSINFGYHMRQVLALSLFLPISWVAFYNCKGVESQETEEPPSKVTSLQWELNEDSRIDLDRALDH